MLISIDTEDSGVDFFHGAKPFLVTTCDEAGRQLHWEWAVDPLTREPRIPQEDVREVQELLDSADHIALQNSKFDWHALRVIGIRLDWAKVQDTLIAGHLLGTNLPHNLTDMVTQYLGKNIEPWEERLKAAVSAARNTARAEFGGKVIRAERTGIIQQPKWRIAEKGLPEMPSAKGGKKTDKRGVESESPWKFDCWLPRAVATEKRWKQPAAGCNHSWRQDQTCAKCRGHRWWIITAEYANKDSWATLLLWQEMRDELERRSLRKIYDCRMKLLPVAAEMEVRGVTLSRRRLEELRASYREASEAAVRTCVGIAAGLGAELTPPRSGNSRSLLEFVFGRRLVKERIEEVEEIVTNGHSSKRLRVRTEERWEACPGLGLEPLAHSDKTGAPSLDKTVLEYWEETLPPRTPGLLFAKTLRGKRSRDTAVNYLMGYQRYWEPALTAEEWADVLPTLPRDLYDEDEWREWFRLHPSLNPTGTDHLRWSGKNPNPQNISKKENFNLRRCFGPAPGREWWSLDAQNIELRIPAFEAGEEELMEVFLHPERAPYFGSYHLVIFDLFHPELFRQHGKACKDLFESTWYQWVKNFNFAVLYGAQEKKADATAHVQGAYRMVKHRFRKMGELNDRQMAMAERLGYIETIPDRDVDSERGYPILCGRSDFGRVTPTTPLNYHVSGTAMQWMGKGMIRTEERLREWRSAGFDAFITLQVHDELVFDLPRRACPKRRPKESNLGRIRQLQRLMEQGGLDIGVPTPVAIEYNPEDWSSGVRL